MIKFVPRSYRESFPVIISHFHNLERDAERGERAKERERERGQLFVGTYSLPVLSRKFILP
jgi:hypothetical protein